MDASKVKMPRSNHYLLTKFVVGGIIVGLLFFAASQTGEANEIEWLRLSALALFFVAFVWSVGCFLVMIALLIRDLLGRQQGRSLRSHTVLVS